MSNQIPQKQISFNTTLNARDALDDLLLQITKKYDLANNSSLNSKQIVPRRKPLLLLHRFLSFNISVHHQYISHQIMLGIHHYRHRLLKLKKNSKL